MQAVAFFDVDGTLWSERSVVSFYQLFLELERPREARELWALFTEQAASLQAANTPREQLNAWFYENHFRGLEVGLVASVAKRWYERHEAVAGFFREAVLQRVREHRAKKHVVVLVTGSFREVVQPLVELIGASSALVAPLEERDGVYTGRLTGAPTIGLGKAIAVDSFLEANAIERGGCYGYGDDDTDIPFLERVGRPTLVVNASSPLAALARARSWDVLDPFGASPS